MGAILLSQTYRPMKFRSAHRVFPQPASLSSQILKVLAQVVPERDLHAGGVAQAVVNLSRLFTTTRAILPLHYLDDPVHASAYLSYFLPVNLSKVQVLLDELLENNGMDEASDRPMTVLDLGCGPGTGALALLDWLWHRSPEQAKSLSVLATDVSQEIGRASCRERVYSSV